jgi:hypothetical protein
MENPRHGNHARPIQVLRSFLLGASTSALVACGGGGSGSGGTAPIQISADMTSVKTQALVTDASVTMITITVTALNTPSGGWFLRAAASNGGIASLSPGAATGNSAQVQIFFKNPYTLAPNTYSDSVQLQACADSSCSQVVGNALQIPVSYTVAAVTGVGAPALTTSFLPIFVHSLVTDANPPSAPGGGISVINAPSGFRPTIAVTASKKGVGSVTYGDPLVVGNALSLPIDIQFQAPSSLGEGLYQDTITITACLDPNCVNPIAGSPLTVSITYQVGNSIPGANGYTVSTVSVQADDVVWDAAHGLLYASVQATSTDPARIVAIDPKTGLIQGSAALASEGGRLAISDDGNTLYVGMRTVGIVKRLTLPELTSDIDLTLPSVNVLGQTYAYDLTVAPNQPGTVAISLHSSGWPSIAGSDAGVAVFDDAVMRPQIGNGFNSVGPPSSRFATWGDTAATLYSSGSGGFQVLSVDVTGATAQTLTNTLPSFSRLHYLAGRVYDEAGQTIDPQLAKSLGSLPPDVYRHKAIPDGANSRFIALDDNGGTNTMINFYDLNTLAATQSLPILGYTLGLYDTPGLVAWGDHGIAYTTTSGQIVIIDGVGLAQ